MALFLDGDEKRDSRGPSKVNSGMATEITHNITNSVKLGVYKAFIGKLSMEFIAYAT
jgi:hypothetical protein